jgi:transcriptional regulator with PAS, ATPase and Fis domain
MARRFADKHSSVLITGESGTGKEIFAHAIHHASPRKDGPFIRINCSCFPPQLLESELFGYEGGAFTGAKREGKPGKFELAYKGTIFLDEIGDLPLEIQPKLLRVLEEREVWRLGGTTPRRTDFRIIASTNKNLEEMVKVDRFREDLYFRLNVLVLYIPPLRDRKEDISLLSRSLLAELNSELGTNFEISNGTLEALKSYDWPGNVRELRNVLERAIAIAEKGSIELENLPLHLLHTADHLAQAEGRNTEGLLGLTLGKTEYDLLTKILKTTGGNKTLSARLLGISRTSLYEKLNKYGIRN